MVPGLRECDGVTELGGTYAGSFLGSVLDDWNVLTEVVMEGTYPGIR
jgi:hypothetical protein